MILLYSEFGFLNGIEVCGLIYLCTEYLRPHIVCSHCPNAPYTTLRCLARLPLYRTPINRFRIGSRERMEDSANHRKSWGIAICYCIWLQVAAFLITGVKDSFHYHPIYFLLSNQGFHSSYFFNLFSFYCTFPRLAHFNYTFM